MTFTPPVGLNPVALCKTAWRGGLQRQSALLGGVEGGRLRERQQDRESQRRNSRETETHAEITRITNSKAKKESLGEWQADKEKKRQTETQKGTQ